MHARYFINRVPAKDRILQRLNQWVKKDPPIEYRLTMTNMWSRKVFVAMLSDMASTPIAIAGSYSKFT